MFLKPNSLLLGPVLLGEWLYIMGRVLVVVEEGGNGDPGLTSQLRLLFCGILLYSIHESIFRTE
jgi:hypothetical protein